MKSYKIEVQNQEDAIDKVRQMYYSEEIVIGIRVLQAL